jgi:LCP family protein required for cell wall assembly
MKKKFLLSFLIGLLCFSFVFIGLSKNSFVKGIFNTDNVDGKDTDVEFSEENPMEEQKIKNEILFLLMGVDAKDVKESRGTRTDTMMLTKVNFDTGEINLLSIPRDTRVLIKDKEDKINHAHSNGGVELTMRTVKDFLNLDIDYYVKVDYEIVKGVVDAIGGVEIDVPRNMKYYDSTKGFPLLDINIKKGLQVLDGKNAHDFLRWRHNNEMTRGYELGDIGRIETQQYFMKELIKQTLKPKNLFKLPKLIETYFENVETNIPKNLMIKGAMSSKKIDVENMKTATIPGEFQKIKGIDYWKYNRAETVNIVEEMFGDYILD